MGGGAKNIWTETHSCLEKEYPHSNTWSCLLVQLTFLIFCFPIKQPRNVLILQNIMKVLENLAINPVSLIKVLVCRVFCYIMTSPKTLQAKNEAPGIYIVAYSLLINHCGIMHSWTPECIVQSAECWNVYLNLTSKCSKPVIIDLYMYFYIDRV